MTDSITPTQEQIFEIRRIATEKLEKLGIAPIDTPPVPVAPVIPAAKWSATMDSPAKVAATKPAKPAATQVDLLGPMHEIPESVDPLLVTILSWVRAHDTISEFQFCGWLRKHIEETTGKPCTIMKDAKGAIAYTVYRPDAKPSTVLFSAHVDTVDGSVTQPGVKKNLTYDPNFGHIMLDKSSVGGCLGADDGVGIWIMLKMIERKVPGTYIFHRGEEVGGVSSKLMAVHYKDWLAEFDVACAFDRPRDNEVITHQRGGTECASEKFALALCERLNSAGMNYKPSKAGVYTDTYEYRGLIPECVNLGVGYTDQHGRQETQDYAHAVALMDACCSFDWEALPIDRDHTKPEVKSYPAYNGRQYGGVSGVYGGNYGGSYGLTDSEYDDPDWWKKDKSVTGKKNGTKQGKGKGTAKPTYHAPTPTIDQELMGLTYEDITCMAEDDPQAMTTLVVELMLELAKVRAQSDMYKQLLGPCANA